MKKYVIKRRKQVRRIQKGKGTKERRKESQLGKMKEKGNS